MDFTSLKLRLKKLTLFDLSIFILFTAILGVLFILLFRRAETIRVTVKVDEQHILYEPWRKTQGTRLWFAQMFHVGMKQKDGLGRTRAEVIKVFSYDTFPNVKAVYLTIKLNTVFSRASNQYTYQGLPILVGSTIKLFLDQLHVEGLITQVEGVNDNREEKKIIVQAEIREETPVYPETSGARPHIAVALEIGQEVKDSQGKTVIKILDKRVEDAKKVVTTSDGRLLTQTNPLRKNIFLTLEINAKKVHNRYYLFDDIPILIGQPIPINTHQLFVLFSRLFMKVLDCQFLKRWLVAVQLLLQIVEQ